MWELLSVKEELRRIRRRLRTYLRAPLVENDLYIQNLPILLQRDLREEISKHIKAEKAVTGSLHVSL